MVGVCVCFLFVLFCFSVLGAGGHHVCYKKGSQVPKYFGTSTVCWMGNQRTETILTILCAQLGNCVLQTDPEIGLESVTIGCVLILLNL